MARLTPEEYAALKAKAKPVVPATVTAPNPAVREQSRQAEEAAKTTKSALAADTARQERIRADIALEKQKSGLDFSQEVARLNAEADVKASAPPIYMGAYDPGLTTPLLGYVPPARPMNIAVPKAEAPGLLEAMRPQVMAPPVSEAMSANRTAKVFDDPAFMQSIADMPPAEKQKAINTHNAFKKAFFKLREMNPVETGVTDEELLKDLRKQITDFETGKGPTLTQGAPNRGDIGGALERQVTPATLQMARPGALTYFSELSSAEQSAGADSTAKTAIENLRKNGVPVMAPVPGSREGLERQTGTRPASPADINRVGDDARKAYVESHPIPLSMLANRDELLAKSEESATGGTLFQKEYITGATVESSMSHALRSAFALPNYIAGVVGEVITPESTRMREQAARPAGQRDMSAAAYNVAVGGGLFKPISDLWTYSPVEAVRDNAAFGQTFGLAADLLSLEAGAVGGVASGGRAMLGATKALGAARETSALRAAGIILSEGLGTGFGTTAKSIGLPSVAKALMPGDLRLIGATDVAENYKALIAYENEIANGGVHNSAMQAAKEAAPYSNAVTMMSKEGPSFSPAAFVKDSKTEYDEFKAINEAIDKVAAGDETADVLKLRPYLKSGLTDNATAKILETVSPITPAGASEEVARAEGQRRAAGRLAPTLRVKDVVEIIKNDGNLDNVRKAAAFDKGFKAVDRAVGALEPGKEVIAITPRTFATKKVADEVIKVAADSPAVQLMNDIQKRTKPEEISFTLGGRTVNDVGYNLSDDEVTGLIAVLQKEANTGTVPKNVVNKIVQELRNKAISSSSIRELSYSVADGVAEQIQTTKQQIFGQGSFAATGLYNKAKAITYGEQTNSIKLTIEKITKKVADSMNVTEQKQLASMLNDVQLESVRVAKSKVGQVDKILVNEFESLSDPAVAARYGLPPDSNRSQKMAAITFGQNPDPSNIKSTVYNYLKSTIFGTTNLSLMRVFGEIPKLPQTGFKYSTFEDIFNADGLAEIDKIVSKYAELIGDTENGTIIADNALKYLPQMTAEVEDLTKSLQIVESQSAKAFVGGKSAAIAAERDAAIAAAKAERDAAKPKALAERNAAKLKATENKPALVNRANQIRSERLSKVREERVAAKATATAAKDAALAQPETQVKWYQKGPDAKIEAEYNKRIADSDAIFAKEGRVDAKEADLANDARKAVIRAWKEEEYAKTATGVDKAAVEKKFADDMKAIIDKSVADSKAIEAQHQVNLENIETRYTSDLEAANTNYSDAIDSVGSKYAADLEAANAKFAADNEAAAQSSVGYAAVGTVTKKKAFLTSEFSGKNVEPGIFKLNRPEEALIGTYARNKGDEIFTEEMSNILAFDPLTTGITTRAVGYFPAFNVDGIIQRAVAHQLSGGAPINSLEDLFSIPGMEAIVGKQLGTGSPPMTIKQALINARGAVIFSDLVEDINGTAQVVARKFGGGVPAIEYANELQQIANGNIKISELGDAPNPFSLRNAIRAELGTEAKYGELMSELGKIAEQEAGGSVSAAKVNRYVNSMLDMFNTVFYNAMLSYRPRFHGRNILTAPFIANMTTGLVLGPYDMLRGARVLDPASVQGVGKTFLEESRAAGAIAKDIKNDVIVIDKLGNQYTSLELYKLAVESGILKTEMSASVDARFIDEAAKLGLGQSPTAAVTRTFPGPMKALSYPSYMASAEDNMWRMATVIHGLESGETLEGALQLGRRSLFDFGAATEFERKFVARKILFYNYFRNSLLQGVKTLLENPGRMLRQYRMATDLTKMSVGDADWNNLRLYGPQDAGVASIAIQYSPSNRKEGQVTVLPSMPYNDIAMMSAGLLYSPMDFLAGQKVLSTGEREYGKGFIIGKLAPVPRGTFNFIAGQTMDDVKMAANQLSPTHIAAAATFQKMTGVPAVQALTEMFNAKPRPALPGEKAYDGIVYELSPKDFDSYKMYLVKTIQYTGTSAAVNEWAKSYSGTDLAGTTASTYSEALGLTSKYAAPTPESLQRKAADLSAGMLEAGTSEKEVEASLKRPKAPAAGGRVK